jgi:UDP-glucose 4-epimerase
MPTNLVTGGAGFIGSHLAEHLVDRGEPVVVLDDLSTGNMANLAGIRHSPLFEFVEGSIVDKQLVLQLLDRVDRVYHLAAAVGVDLIVKEPAKVIETNVLGTDHILSGCAHRRVPVLLASTSEVYGKSADLPFTEESDLVLGPTSKSRWSYACSKAIDEFLALAYNATHDLPVVVARFFNTTGPRQTGRYGMVVPRFVEQALRGDPITVYGDGTQDRCFSHVADIVPAIIALLDEPQAFGQVVNLGSEERVTIAELAQRIKAMTGSDSAITQVAFEDAYRAGFDDILSRQPDITKARRLIGFEPSRTLDDILRSVIAWKQAIAEAPVAGAT